MKNQLLRIGYLLTLIAFMFSCNTEEDLLIEEPVPEGQEMVFNEKGYNPYLPENMQMAFDSLKSKVYENFPGARTTTEGIELDFTPNNQYVRFLPKDSLEYDTLMSYEDLALFDYPIDKPVVQEGDYTPEPANEEGFHWLYGVVSEGFQFPPVNYELINDVYLPEYADVAIDESSAGRVTSDSVEINGMLLGVELYSLYLSGHLSEEETDELLAILEGEEPSNGRVDNSAWDVFINGLKSVRNTIGSIFITPAYAKKANPTNWCWGCIWNSSWKPNGRIQIRFNNGTAVRERPIAGLRVVIHKALKSIVAYTDNNGNFSSWANFGSKVTYTAHFRNRESSAFGNRYFRIIKKNSFYTTKTHDLRSNTRDDNITHTYDLTNNSGRVDNLNEMAACIYAAAWDFYHVRYFWIGDVQKPRNRLRIRIADESGRGSHSVPYFFLSNHIKMFAKFDNGTYRNIQSIMATTFHELGHASHYNLDGCCLWNNEFLKEGDKNEDKILKESWALFLEHQYTGTWFPNYNGDISQGLTFTRMNQDFPTGREGKYTSLFFDLEDRNDQSNNGSLTDLPRDRVSGYTTEQMQSALSGVSDLQGLRDNLFNKYDNSTEEFLQELVDSYSDNLNAQR